MDDPSISPRVAKILYLLGEAQRDRNQITSLQAHLAGIHSWPADDLRLLLEQMNRGVEPWHRSGLASEWIFQALRKRIAAQVHDPVRRETEIDALAEPLGQLYQRAPAECAARNNILSVLATGGSFRSLAQFADCICAAPPLHPSTLAIAMAPLISLPQRHWDALFPRLLDGLEHPQLAAAILDVANFAVSEKRMPSHPAADRTSALIHLLSSLCDKLTALERLSSEPPSSVETNQVSESLALIVSLCRALALIGDPAALDSLRKASQLKHRRIRAEAAAAAARLGDPSGIDALLELAQWPVVRSRVIAYADELGLLDRIDPRFTSAEARAEGELAAWLAESTQLGVAPTRLELVDRRELYWPGHSQRQMCYLFRFVYSTPQGEWVNFGIVGPLTHASSASLDSLRIDDRYALFAGWHAAHDEIYDIEWQNLSERQKSVFRRWQDDLQLQFERIEPAFVGRFFGDEFVIAAATRSGVDGHLIFNELTTSWLADEQKRLSSELAYCVFKGRKLLASFNPEPAANEPAIE